MDGDTLPKACDIAEGIEMDSKKELVNEITDKESNIMHEKDIINENKDDETTNVLDEEDITEENQKEETANEKDITEENESQSLVGNSSLKGVDVDSFFTGEPKKISKRRVSDLTVPDRLTRSSSRRID